MRTRRIALLTAAVAVLLAVGALGFLRLLTANNAVERCATDSPAPASGGHVDYGPLPWQWTCRYEDGTEIERSLFDDRSA